MKKVWYFLIVVLVVVLGLFDPSQITQKQILDLGIFREYPATIVS